MKKIIKESKNFQKFDRVGDFIEGKIIRTFNTPTKFGTQDCIEIASLGTGELISVGLSSNLTFYADDLHVNANVRIEYLGKQNNPETGRTFKTFDVYDLDAQDDTPEEDTPSVKGK